MNVWVKLGLLVAVLGLLAAMMVPAMLVEDEDLRRASEEDSVVREPTGDSGTVPDPGDRATAEGPRGSAAPIVRGAVYDADDVPVRDAVVQVLGERRESPGRATTGRVRKIRRELADLFPAAFAGRAEVLPEMGPDATAQTGRRVVKEVRTDGAGDFEVRMPDFGPVRVRAAKGDSISATRTVVPGRTVNLFLRSGAGVTGTVLDRADGRPVPVATVVLVTGGGTRRTRSGPDGGFRFAGLAAGPARLRVDHAEYAPATLMRFLDCGESVEMSVGLVRGHRLTVTLTGVDENEVSSPLAGATVALLRRQDRVLTHTQTDQEGRAVFQGLPAGDYLVNGRGRGHLPAGEEPLFLQCDTECALACDKEVPTVIRVVGPDGAPVSGARLWSTNSWEEFEQGESQMVAYTDHRGVARFPFTWLGSEASVYVTKPGFAMAVVSPGDPSGAEVIDVRLSQGSPLRGHVTDGKGNPVVGAEVSVAVADAGRHRRGLNATGFTDVRGEYSFPDMPAGATRFRIEAPGYEELRTERDTVSEGWRKSFDFTLQAR